MSFSLFSFKVSLISIKIVLNFKSFKFNLFKKLLLRLERLDSKLSSTRILIFSLEDLVSIDGGMSIFEHSEAFST